MVTVPKGSSIRHNRADRCHRCGGLMVAEQVFETASFDWRCVSCGERIDPVILAHRKQDLPRVNSQHLFISRKPRLG